MDANPTRRAVALSRPRLLRSGRRRRPRVRRRGRWRVCLGSTRYWAGARTKTGCWRSCRPRACASSRFPSTAAPASSPRPSPPSSRPSKFYAPMSAPRRHARPPTSRRHPAACPPRRRRGRPWRAPPASLPPASSATRMSTRDASCTRAVRTVPCSSRSALSRCSRSERRRCCVGAVSCRGAMAADAAV